MRKQEVDIRIFTPKYGTIKDEKYHLKSLAEGIEVPTGAGPGDTGISSLTCNIKYFEQEDDPFEPPVYFLENMEYFEKRANVYGYDDDHVRFGLLSRGALEFLKSGEFVPDIVHCNDWHTGYLLNYLNGLREDDERFEQVAGLLTIHNTYQGNFNFSNVSEMDYDDGKSPLAPIFDERFQTQNALKRGIIYADRINTVSETYAKQLLLEEYGAGLHKLLRELRGKLTGILNGLDYVDFDPKNDTIIKKNYSKRTYEDRAVNKKDLQKIFNLEENPRTPIFAMVGRLDGQKGIELVSESIDFLLKELDMQFIILGGGDQKYIKKFEELEKKYEGRVGTHLMPDFVLPRKIFAGADVMMMPSYYEPGGIVAIEAMRYGAVPLVRATGGLADIVKNFNSTTEQGTGFSFKDFSSQSFLVSVVRAYETYKKREVWDELVKRVMDEDFSWDRVATDYRDLYEKTVGIRNKSIAPHSPMDFNQVTM